MSSSTVLFESEACEIARNLSPEARAKLISIIGEILNVTDNLVTICPGAAATCQDYVRFERAHILLEKLNEAHAPS